MICCLKGKLLVKEPTRLVLDVNSIGFEVKVPISTSERLPDINAEVNLLIQMEISKAGIELFGFLTQQELAIFRMITGMKGVGPRVALNLLSRYQPDEVVSAIERKDLKLIRSIPGIGEKKAQAILNLVDTRIKETPGPANQSQSSEIYQSAVNALISLGLSRKEAQERLSRIKFEPGLSLTELLKKALAQK